MPDATPSVAACNQLLGDLNAARYIVPTKFYQKLQEKTAQAVYELTGQLNAKIEHQHKRMMGQY